MHAFAITNYFTYMQNIHSYSRTLFWMNLCMCVCEYCLFDIYARYPIHSLCSSYSFRHLIPCPTNYIHIACARSSSLCIRKVEVFSTAHTHKINWYQVKAREKKNKTKNYMHMHSTDDNDIEWVAVTVKRIKDRYDNWDTRQW